ncbi:Trimeric GatFAB AmidoTransferase(AdT) complex subunit [Colletotrichum fioriniae]|uniref:Trimeric GatFAB AmidoTransferase(AdT) complex subunit n=1 Tax=Colletotrichum fioriniae TaxID=710243 RepID=UPI0032DBAAE0|nr:Trimeric GatFAB AmidoTransferase(AdT) complex subunit [Colletotrichum fioriniae]
MSRKHDWVTTLALSYAAGAKIHLSSDITTSPETIDLSPSEYSRFCRAFYRVDLFYVLFGAVGNFNGLSGTGNLLFHRHPPWENEQLGCVHDFVEAKFLEASVDVLAHDVTFGEYQIDYLTTGGDNMMIQLWLSRGLDFLRRLISTTSRESKRVLLESAFNAGRTSLSDALECIMDAHAYNNTDLEDSSTSELGTIIPAYETICNTDKGPYAGCAQATRQQRRSHHDFNHFVYRPDASEATTAAPEAILELATKFKLAVKDNIATQGLPTTCSSAILSSHKSPYEATIVRQLRERGAQVVGKTNMDEFGMGSHSLNSVHGPVLNPLSATPTSAGGSSGGSAVAVQTGEADVALGTDTGGSIRLPAAYCGVVGYKPSYGMLSRFGVVPYANSLDTVGLLARDVDVIENLMFSTGLDAEHDSQDPTSLSESFRKKQQSQAATGRSRLRIGIPLEYNIEELDPEIKAAWSDASDLLQKSGIEVVPVSLPSTKHALSAYYVIAPAEASSNLAKYDGVRYGTRGDDSDGAGEVLYSKTRGLGFGEEVRRRIVLGAYSLSSEAMDNYFIQAQRVRKLVQRDFDRVFRLENPLYDEQQFDLSDMKDEVELQDKLGPSQVDFLLCPTAPTFAPRIEDIKRQTPVQVYMNDVFTVPASLAGLPAISIPTKIKAEDGEVDGSRNVAGLQLIGQYWDDKRLLSVAKNLLRQLSA